ncbi:prenyltransferase/squalene oxidase repeat-containing protein [Saccharopolyspora rosea]|uniref:Prenyltransferase/squalene oxidase repeat-containing protein n=1 Tax=Saccharopolyspora rosea TaxID=524884 RepID=A0ABW3FW39_9PSEU
MTATTALQTRMTLDKAAEYLRRRQDDDGLWRDFATPFGFSADWVTGCVLRSLAGVPGTEDCVARGATALLQRQRPNGGWGFNENVPTDCDSTVWALLGLLAVERAPESTVDAARGYLEAHRDATTGGFSVYTDADEIDTSFGLEPDFVHGWKQPAHCVTAAVVQALLACGGTPELLVRQAVRYLLDAQRPDGSWTSYWWHDAAYPTLHAVTALVAGGASRPEALERCVALLVSRQEPSGAWATPMAPDGHPFATACHLEALLAQPTTSAAAAAAERAAAWLREAQNPDGGWTPYPIMRIPMPNTVDPAEVTDWYFDEEMLPVVLRDANGLYTTAAAVHALRTAVAREESR